MLFGGTFNPFHIGHFEILSALCERNEIDKVYIMPDKIPPHKSCVYLAPDSDRVKMCELAAESFDKAEVLTVELEREGKSYTFDTVSELKKRFPATEFALCCGGDMIATLDTWYRGPELIRLLPVYAFCRSGDTDFAGSVERLRKMGADIAVINKEITAVSSTELRKKICSGCVSGLLPKKIEEYIKGRGLYA